MPLFKGRKKMGKTIGKWAVRETDGPLSRIYRGDIFMDRETVYLLCYNGKRKDTLGIIITEQFPLYFPKKRDCIVIPRRALRIFSVQPILPAEYGEYAGIVQPILFTIYTWLCKSTFRNCLQHYADNNQVLYRGTVTHLRDDLRVLWNSFTHERQ